MRVCAYALTRQSLRCSFTQSMHVDKAPGRYLDLLLRWIRQHGRFSKAFACADPESFFRGGPTLTTFF